MTLEIELDREEDGRWIAEVPSLPGVLTHGDTPERAAEAAKALALQVMLDQAQHGERLLPNLFDFKYRVPA
jgi:predicted RNase H-like HicB family nuclease